MCLPCTWTAWDRLLLGLDDIALPMSNPGQLVISVTLTCEMVCVNRARCPRKDDPSAQAQVEGGRKSMWGHCLPLCSVLDVLSNRTQHTETKSHSLQVNSS